MSGSNSKAATVGSATGPGGLVAGKEDKKKAGGGVLNRLKVRRQAPTHTADDGAGAAITEQELLALDTIRPEHVLRLNRVTESEWRAGRALPGHRAREPVAGRAVWRRRGPLSLARPCFCRPLSQTRRARASLQSGLIWAWADPARLGPRPLARFLPLLLINPRLSQPSGTEPLPAASTFLWAQAPDSPSPTGPCLGPLWGWESSGALLFTGSLCFRSTRDCCTACRLKLYPPPKKKSRNENQVFLRTNLIVPITAQLLSISNTDQRVKMHSEYTKTTTKQAETGLCLHFNTWKT